MFGEPCIWRYHRPHANGFRRQSALVDGVRVQDPVDGVHGSGGFPDVRITLLGLATSYPARSSALLVRLMFYFWNATN